uniref:NAD(P)/FAD-dependent oxidoreductase n=1 Tax=Pontibacterium sp. TaxID=2036026 RepID=UPI00356B4145
MIKTDVVIVGAGPCGLFQVFELGLLGIHAHVIEALPYAGGQCIQLYPDKPIYDIPAIPEISARGLVENLLAQIQPFAPEFHFEQRVISIQPTPNGRFTLETDTGVLFDTGAVVIASGAGAIRPIQLRVDGIDQFKDQQLFYAVTDEARHRGKRL